MATSQKEQTAPAPTPLELLGSDSWSFAFFTTYALSLTFFEAVVLRELRRVGCEEVWIFVDADGYRASLAERRAFRVGQEYRVIPVALPKGVFHPKCTFLASANSELLMIGSGNITFGGFGRNLEVLDAQSPRSNPVLTRQFAGFVDALSTRADLQIPERGGLRKLAQLARNAADAGGEPETDNVRLLHSCESPILQGIRDSVGELGACRRLTVLSPYFDSSGDAIKALADAIDAEEVVVGMPPNKPQACGFSFAAARKWKRKVSAAMPELVDETRTLHAKWFEAEFQRGVVTLTGSVNATWPALCTTDNIEVGILRIAPKSGTWVRWAKAPIPQAANVDVEREDRVRAAVLYAQLDAAGSVRGSVLGAADLAGRWGATLSDTGDQFQVFSVEVAESGNFSASVPNCERFAFASALQLSLEKGGRTVRGWVHQEDILRMPRLRRLGVTSLLRLINRQETEEDDVALLDYLSLSANKHLRLFSEPIADGGARRSQADGDAAVHKLGEIVPDEGTQPGRPGHGGSHSTEAILERVFARLRRRIVHRDLEEGLQRGPVETEEDDSDDELKQKARRGAALQRVLTPALERFETSIRREIELAEAEGKDDERRALLVIWFEVKQHMLLSRLNRRDLAFEFAKTWLAQVSGSGQAHASPGPLEQYVFTCTALCSLLAPKDGRTLLRARLHEDLEKFCAGSVNAAVAADSVLSGEHVSFVALLIGSTNADLRAELEEILQTKTVRQQLEEAYSAYCDGAKIPQDLPVFQGWIGGKLYEAMSANGPRRVKALKDRRAMCAFEFLAFQGADKQQLERSRIVQCVNCKRFTIQLAP